MEYLNFIHQMREKYFDKFKEFPTSVIYGENTEKIVERYVNEENKNNNFDKNKLFLLKSIIRTEYCKETGIRIERELQDKKLQLNENRYLNQFPDKELTD